MKKIRRILIVQGDSNTKNAADYQKLANCYKEVYKEAAKKLEEEADVKVVDTITEEEILSFSPNTILFLASSQIEEARKIRDKNKDVQIMVAVGKPPDNIYIVHKTMLSFEFIKNSLLC